VDDRPTDPLATHRATPELRAALERERSRALEVLREGVVAPEPMTYGSQAAAASQVFEQQRDLALLDRTRRSLDEIEAAIARLDAGTYGVCTGCGGPIAPERLEARPWAALCIDCQRASARTR
jgi:DnaK suppressor protein